MATSESLVTNMDCGHKLRLKYCLACRELGISADPSILTCLETNWKHLISCGSYSLLPLLLAFQSNDDLDSWNQIESIRLYHDPDSQSSLPNPVIDTNARIVRQIMEKSNTLKVLDVTMLGLGYNGLLQIGYGVRNSTSLRKLKLRGNRRAFHAFGEDSFLNNLKQCKTLKYVDISENNLEYSTTGKYRELGEKVQIVFYGNHMYEEILNTITHGIGAVLAIIGSWILIYNAYSKERIVLYSCLVYCFTVIFLYLTSTVYHASFGNKFTSSVMQIVDHCAIYLMIAGNYTPLCLIGLGDHKLGLTIVLTEWVLASLGIILALLEKRVHIPFYSIFELSLYVAMGHMIYLIYDDVYQHINEEAMNLLIYGGLSYVAGIIFFLMDAPIGHVVWHLFVLGGTIFHYFAVLWHVVGLEDHPIVK